MAETESGVLNRQCLGRCPASVAPVAREVLAWDKMQCAAIANPLDVQLDRHAAETPATLPVNRRQTARSMRTEIGQSFHCAIRAPAPCNNTVSQNWPRVQLSGSIETPIKRRWSELAASTHRAALAQLMLADRTPILASFHRHAGSRNCLQAHYSNGDSISSAGSTTVAGGGILSVLISSGGSMPKAIQRKT